MERLRLEQRGRQISFHVWQTLFVLCGDKIPAAQDSFNYNSYSHEGKHIVARVDDTLVGNWGTPGFAETILDRSGQPPFLLAACTTLIVF